MGWRGWLQARRHGQVSDIFNDLSIALEISAENERSQSTCQALRVVPKSTLIHDFVLQHYKFKPLHPEHSFRMSCAFITVTSVLEMHYFMDMSQFQRIPWWGVATTPSSCINILSAPDPEMPVCHSFWHAPEVHAMCYVHSSGSQSVLGARKGSAWESPARAHQECEAFQDDPKPVECSLRSINFGAGRWQLFFRCYQDWLWWIRSSQNKIPSQFVQC